MNKEAGIQDTLISGSKDIVKALATLQTLKAIILGGGAGWLAAKLASPRKQDQANIQKQMQAAATSDAAQKARVRFANEWNESLQGQDQPKTMRI